MMGKKILQGVLVPVVNGLGYFFNRKEVDEWNKKIPILSEYRD
jgi:hypothetical protein